MRVLKSSLVLMILVAGLVGAGFFFGLGSLPDSFRSAFILSMEKDLGGPVQLSRLSFGRTLPPQFAGNGFKTAEEAGGVPRFSAEGVILKPDWISLLTGRTALKALLFNKASARLTVYPDGRAEALMPRPGFRPSGSPGIAVIPEIVFWDTSLWVDVLTRQPPFHFQIKSVDAAVSMSEGQDVLIYQLRGAMGEKGQAGYGTAVFRPGSREIEVAFSDAEQTVMLEGFWLRQRPYDFRGRFDIHEFDGSEFALPLWADNPWLRGTLTASFEVIWSGLHPQDILESIDFEGAADVRGGALGPVNLVRAVLAALSPIPGMQALDGGLKDLPASLTVPDTPFKILQAECRYMSGRLDLREILVKHEDFMIEAWGWLGTDSREMEFRGKLAIMPELSRLLIREIFPLEALMNDHGRIIIPFAWRGLYPGATVEPGLEYVTQKISEWSLFVKQEHESVPEGGGV